MAQATQEITDLSVQVSVGEIYKFTYTYNVDVPFNDPKKEVEKHIKDSAKHYRLVNIYDDATSKTITAYCEVTNNPLPFIVVFGLIVSGIAFLTWLIGLNLKKVEKVITTVSSSPAATAAVGSFSIALLVGAVIAAKYFLFGRST